jgi:signal transduction histidine kinase
MVSGGPRRRAGDVPPGDRLRLLVQVGRILALDLPEEELLERAADAIHELLGYPNVDLPLVDPEDPRFLLVRARGGAYKERIKHLDRLPIERGVMGAAVLEGRTQRVNDVASDPRYVQPPSGLAVRAELAVPVRHSGRVLGVVNVEGEGPFTDLDVELLELVADLLAVAIENARRVAKERRLAALEERQRLARELHDSVTQLLFSAMLLAESVPGALRRDPGEGERRLERVVAANRQALAEMRALLRELAPAPLVDLSSREFPPAAVVRLQRDGLPAALAVELEALREAGVATALDAVGYERQSREREEVLLRVAQEALANVAKHAAAANVRVTLGSREDEVRLSVVDDGRGFDPADAIRAAAGGARDRGFGLASMRERIRGLAGRFRVESAPGLGTTVEVALPR